MRCDSDDYGRVNPLFSSPALVRPSPLRAGPVAEGMEEGLRAALARQDFLPPGSTSSERQSQASDDEQQPAQHRSSIFAHISSWWQRARMHKRDRAADGRQDEFQEADRGQEQPAGGRLRTDMITIEVPSSRCSSASHPSRSRLNTEMDEEGLPLPPLSTSSSPTRRLTKQASDAAAAMLLAISDASPIPRSPKPGPVPNRSWFVDLSPRKSTNLTLMRASPNSINLLQPVSLAAFRSFLQQLWQQHCLDLVLTVILALLLGMLHGPAWQMQQVPAAALGAALSIGLLSLHATMPVFAGVPAGGMAVLCCPWLHFLLAAVQHTLLAAVRSTIFAAIYFSLVRPALPFGSLLLVLVLVSCWCTGLGLLLARLLPVHHLGTMSVSVLFAVGAALNGVFPTLRQLHSTPWFFISGSLCYAC